MRRYLIVNLECFTTLDDETISLLLHFVPLRLPVIKTMQWSRNAIYVQRFKRNHFYFAEILLIDIGRKEKFCIGNMKVY